MEICEIKTSTKIISIHQPAYLPWLGYFHKIALAQEFVILDLTQYEKNSFINRNKVLTPNGATWLTVPVESKGRFKHNLLADTTVDNRRNWQIKHWRTIEQSYGKTKFFNVYASGLRKFYETEYGKLNHLCRDMLGFFIKELGIKTKIVHTSDMDRIQGQKTSLIMNICKQRGATVYLSGELGKGYLDEYQFEQESIRLRYQKFVHPEYHQKSQTFISHLSILDLLFNVGPDSLNVIMQNDGKE